MNPLLEVENVFITHPRGSITPEILFSTANLDFVHTILRASLPKSISFTWAKMEVVNMLHLWGWDTPFHVYKYYDLQQQDGLIFPF